MRPLYSSPCTEGPCAFEAEGAEGEELYPLCSPPPPSCPPSQLASEPWLSSLPQPQPLALPWLSFHFGLQLVLPQLDQPRVDLLSRDFSRIQPDQPRLT